MTRRLSSACFLFFACAAACTSDALPGPTDLGPPDLAARDLAVTADGGGSCGALAAQVTDYLAKHRACQTDADCATTFTDCGLPGVCGTYINQADAAGLKNLIASWQAMMCATGQPCPDCGVPAPPACVMGQCAASPSLIVDLQGLSIAQSCMPLVPPDPVTIQGTLIVGNPGGTTSASFSTASGAILSGAVVQLAAFKIVPIGPQSIPPMSKQLFMVSKLQNSLDPAGGCTTLKCGSDVFVALDYTVGTQPGRSIAQAKVQCAF